MHEDLSRCVCFSPNYISHISTYMHDTPIVMQRHEDFSAIDDLCGHYGGLPPTHQVMPLICAAV